MATEGHSWDCGCECCAEERETKPACVCPECGQKLTGEALKACQDKKCPQCGADLKQS